MGNFEKKRNQVRKAQNRLNHMNDDKFVKSCGQGINLPINDEPQIVMRNKRDEIVGMTNFDPHSFNGKPAKMNSGMYKGKKPRPNTFDRMVESIGADFLKLGGAKQLDRFKILNILKDIAGGDVRLDQAHYLCDNTLMENLWQTASYQLMLANANYRAVMERLNVIYGGHASVEVPSNELKVLLDLKNHVMETWSAWNHVCGILQLRASIPNDDRTFYTMYSMRVQQFPNRMALRDLIRY